MTDTIRSKEPTDEYRSGWDRIFGGRYTGPERRLNGDAGNAFGFAQVRMEGGYNHDPLRGGRERRKDWPMYEGSVVADGTDPDYSMMCDAPKYEFFSYPTSTAATPEEKARQDRMLRKSMEPVRDLPGSEGT